MACSSMSYTPFAFYGPVPVSFPTTHRHTLTLNTRNMSKKIFSAQEWENAPSKKDSPDKSSPISSYSSSSDVQSRVEEIISEIESRGLDIAPSYDEWVKLGFALASEFKEMGREYFHRLSRLHPDYEFNTTDKQYNNCLNSKGSGVVFYKLKC